MLFVRLPLEKKKRNNMSKEQLKQAQEIVAKHTVKNGKFNGEMCIITVIDGDGYPYPSVITPSSSRGIEELTFGINTDSDKMKCLANNKKVGICFAGAEYSLTLFGDAEIITDPKLKKDLWYDGLSNHFEKGHEDPNYAVLKFKTRRHKLFVY